MFQNNISNIADTLFVYFINYLIMFGGISWLLIGMLFGFCLITGLLFANKVWGKGLIVFSLLCVLIQPALFYFPELIQNYGVTYRIYDDYIYQYIWGGLATGVITLLGFSLYMSPIDKVKTNLLNRCNATTDTKTDIRTVEKHLPNTIHSYDPEVWMNSKKIFTGLNDKNKPSFLNEDVSNSHIHLMGTTGAGKTVEATNILVQSINRGEAVIVIDPKNDEYLPHALGQAAKKKNVDFIYIDLLGDTPQFDPFYKKSVNENEENLTAGFGLFDIGQASDFYKLYERKAARLFARHVYEETDNLVDVFTDFVTKNPVLQKEAPKFFEDLSELLSLRVTHVTDGLNISDEIKRGSVIYVRGSLRNPRVLKLQKMFLMNVIHACENREREGSRRVRIFLDEFKFLISKPALEALASIRDKNASMILANQSYGDLRSCPNDIDPESVLTSVSENCSIKIVYKIRDPETAERLAKLSGTIQVPDEVLTLRPSKSLFSSNKPDISVRNTERYLIDTNMMLSLPKNCAVLYGDGQAEFIFISPMKVEKKPEYVKPTRFDLDYEIPNSHDVSITSIAEGLLDVD